MGDMGRTYGGGYAAYTSVLLSQVIPVETDLPWEVLGALPEILQTAYGSLTVGLDSVGDLDGRGQVPRVRQDFERWIACWSRRVWKAVGGLAGEVSSVADRALRRSMFTAMAVSVPCPLVPGAAGAGTAGV